MQSQLANMIANTLSKHGTLKSLLHEPGWTMKDTPGRLSTGEAAQTFSTSLEEIQNNATQSISYHEWRQQPGDHDPLTSTRWHHIHNPLALDLDSGNIADQIEQHITAHQHHSRLSWNVCKDVDSFRGYSTAQCLQSSQPMEVTLRTSMATQQG